MTSTPNEIHVGDLVRSYDFPDVPGMKTTCFVEGVVEAIGPVPGVLPPDRYSIKITRRIWQGKEDTGWQNGKEFPTGHAYPPVNGIASWLGGVTNSTKLLPPEVPEPADPPGLPVPTEPVVAEPPPLTWGQLASGRKALVVELEKHLRDKGWPYVAVDEAKKAIFASSSVKAFDYLVYSGTGPNLLVLVVTRRPTAVQVRQMQEWENIFGPDFQAVFTFRAGGWWCWLGLKDLEAKEPLSQCRSSDEALTQTPSSEGSKQ